MGPFHIGTRLDSLSRICPGSFKLGVKIHAVHEEKFFFQ
jgi:hypothetical protein